MTFPALCSKRVTEGLVRKCRRSLLNGMGVFMGYVDSVAVQTNGEVCVGNRCRGSKLTTLVSLRETELNSSNLFHIEGGN